MTIEICEFEYQHGIYLATLLVLKATQREYSHVSLLKFEVSYFN